MPQPRKISSDGWISSELIPRPPRGHLEETEIAAFLGFLFSDVAHRPEVARLREGAAVVRCLRTLAWQGVPPEIAKDGAAAVEGYWRTHPNVNRDERQLLERLAGVIWAQLLQFAAIKPSSKATATRFLRRHAKTYLSGVEVEAALKAIEGLEAPADAVDPFRPPKLMSRHMSAQGQENPYLQDDLSERIYTAYHALKRENRRGIRGRLAEALTALGVSTGAQRRTGRSGWTPEDVNERIKEYLNRQRKRFREQVRDENIEPFVGGWCNYLVDRWISAFRLKQQSEKLGR